MKTPPLPQKIQQGEAERQKLFSTAVRPSPPPPPEVEADIRAKVSLTPRSLTDAKLLTYTQTPSVSNELVKGKKRDVYTYKGEDGVTITSTGKTDEIPNILETTKRITDYADQYGKLRKTQNGYIAEIEYNNLLQLLGYTKRKNGSYSPKDRRTVWKKLKETFTTPVIMTVPFKPALSDQVKTLVIETPLVTYGEIYDTEDAKEATLLSLSTPPKSFVVIISEPLALQMLGFREGKTYYNRNLLAEPRREAEANKYEQGYHQRVEEKLFYEFSRAVKPIRRYHVKALLEVIGGRESDRKGKLIKALNRMEQQGKFNEWVFCASRHKNYTKKERNQPLIWVNHEGTDAFNMASSFYQGKNKPEDIKEMKKDIRELKKGVKKLQKDL